MGFFSDLFNSIFGPKIQTPLYKRFIMSELKTIDPDKFPDPAQFVDEDTLIDSKGRASSSHQEKMASWPPSDGPAHGMSATFEVGIENVFDPSAAGWDMSEVVVVNDIKLYFTIREHAEAQTREVFALVTGKIHEKTAPHIGFYSFPATAAHVFADYFKMMVPIHLTGGEFYSLSGTLTTHHLVISCNGECANNDRHVEGNPLFKMRTVPGDDRILYSMIYHNSDPEALRTDAGMEFLMSLQKSR